MRHRKRIKKLGRDHEHRKALLRNQVISLLLHGKIKTTLAKAKETRRWAEKMITLAKEDTVHSRRMARRFLIDRKITNHLFDKIGPLFKEINGGYTRIYRLGPRRGDGAELAILELTRVPESEQQKS